MSTQSLTAPRGLGEIGRSLGRIIGSVPRWLLVVLAVLVIVGLVAGTIVSRSQGATQIVTAPVVRQTLTQSVTASGTVNAQNSVTVGSQVSGTISQLDADFNSKVKKGQVLARLDPSSLQAQLEKDRANLAQAQAQAAQASANASGAGAGVTVAEANANAQNAAANAAKTNINKAQAALVLAQEQLTRDSSLLAQGYIAQATVDTDRSTVAQADAALAQAQAAYAQAQAQAAASSATIGQNGSTAQAQAASADAAQSAIQAAEATLQADQLNLNHTVITSPVDGTVVSRAVSVGQTVAASLQAPTLFTIAQDLKAMEVDINVGEPDIGGVKKGDGVDFSVLAYPDQTFHGAVREVRINPQTVNNVVTYDVVVDVDNADGKLLPGMTANATISVASSPNALVVPLSALHVRSSSGGGSSTALRSAQNDTAASPWGGTGTSAGTVATGQTASLMVQRNGKLQRVRVLVGLVTSTQAAVTPVDGGTLSEGDNVVTAFSAPRQARANAGRSSPLSGRGGAPHGATRGMP